MFGITSYKDLEYWDDIHREPNYDSGYRSSRSSFGSGAPLLEMMVTGRSSFQNTTRNLGYQEESNRGCYVILLGNLLNETDALKLVLNNYEILNIRTKNVRFFMPGFLVGKDGIVASQTVSHEEKFQFFPKGYVETVEWLENGNPEYHYSENMEMVLLPYEKLGRETVYDFGHMLSYDLDNLLAEKKNIISFITRAVQVVQRKMSYEETRIQMEGVTTSLPRKNSHKVFIAGSKSLDIERDGIRAAFSQLTNRSDILFQTWTFEDFDRSFTQGGRQSDYNSFITNEADSVVFILSDKVGGITKNEFQIALDSYQRTRHPQIYVYNCINDGGVFNPEIQEIRDEIDRNGQYFTDYRDPRDLKMQILRDFNQLTAE